MYLEREVECRSDNSSGYKNTEIVAQTGHKLLFDCSHQKHLNLTNQMNDLVGSFAAERIVVDRISFEKRQMKAVESSQTPKNGMKMMVLVEAQSCSYSLPLLLLG